MSYNKAIPGATLLVYINGKVLALGGNLSVNIDEPKKEIRGLDTAEVVEYAPTVIKITGSIDLIRGHGDGGAEGLGTTAQPSELTREKYFTILILDRFTKKPVFQSNYCTATSQAWNFPTRGVVTGRLAFNAITWSNDFSA